ncbi:MAG: aldehyde-activating protein, partial [Halobacteria archaeon]|nr:aldehyde-activating protein [Halobacteria archaeon]
ESGFVWIRGKEKVSSYSKENGYKASFCSCCGNPVPNKFRDFPLFSVPVGSLDGGFDIEVVVQIYLGSRAKWDKDHIEGQKFVEMPPINEMLAFLHVHV